MIPPGGSRIFVYGTLMSPKVLHTLIERTPLSQAAHVFGFSRHPVKEYVFPGTIPSSNKLDKVEGILLEGLADAELKRLDWFEGDEYERATVSVHKSSNSDTTVSAYLYLWNNPQEELELDQTWDFDSFCTNDLENYLKYTVEPCKIQLDNLYPDELSK